MATLLSDQARVEREKGIENALASVRMEGLEPPEEAKAIFQRYIDGDLSAEAMGKAIDSLLDSEYGSLRLPGNGRS